MNGLDFHPPLKSYSPLSYPLGSANLEESGHVEGKLDHGVVLAQTAAHLVPGTEVHDRLHLHVPGVPLDVRAVLAVAKVGVAGLKEQGRVQGILFVVKRSGDESPVIVEAIAPIDAPLRTQISQLQWKVVGWFL